MNEAGLTPFAWIFMILSMGAVTALAVYCYYRILFTGDGGVSPEDGVSARAIGDAPPDSGSAPPSP